MRISPSTTFERKRRRSRGIIAVAILLAMLSVMLVFVGAGMWSLSSLGREVKLVEQKQIRHWNALSATNSMTALPIPPAPGRLDAAKP